MENFNYRNILIHPGDTIRQAIEAIEAGVVQIALVVDENHHLLGTVTDGDVRRSILRGVSLDQPVELAMNPNAIIAGVHTDREELLSLMVSQGIKQVPLVDQSRKVLGLEVLDNLLQKPLAKDNPVLILAGGQGSRLRPLTNQTPKALLKVGGKPIIELILRQLRTNGLHNIFISVNYLASLIEEHFGDGQKDGVSIQYLREQEPLGTAGPLALLPQPLEMPAIVVNGDLMTKVNFENMLEFHREGEFDFTIGVKEYPFQLPFGVVVTSGDRVEQFQEKPIETQLINAGIYVLNPEVIDLVPRGTYFDMNELIEKLLSRPESRVGAFLIHEYWMDIGNNRSYGQAQQDYQVHFAQ